MRASSCSYTKINVAGLLGSGEIHLFFKYKEPVGFLKTPQKPIKSIFTNRNQKTRHFTGGSFVSIFV